MKYRVLKTEIRKYRMLKAENKKWVNGSIGFMAVTVFAVMLTVGVTPAFATASYNAPPYVQASYGTQWTVSGVTPIQTIPIQDGGAGRVWQVYQINNTGDSPLTNAIATIQITAVEVDGVWYTGATYLSMVKVLDSNGFFIGVGCTAYVQVLGTINTGGYSQHVLNMEYSSGVQDFMFSFNVWYIPS